VFVAAVAMVWAAACGGEAPGASGAGGGAGSSDDATATIAATSGAGGGAAQGTGGGGGAGLPSADAIVDALRADLEGALRDLADGSGLPVATDQGYLFVSTLPGLDLLTGDHDGWTGTPMHHEDGFAWLALEVAPGSRYKLTDGATYAADPWSRSYTYDEFGEMSLVAPVAPAHLDRFFFVGDAENEARTIRVWVPEGTFDRVLYAHDGQNLFDPGALWGGWHLQEAAPSGVLIVGVDNTAQRMDEYTHVPDQIGGQWMGGAGDAYAAFLEGTVRPLVQARYGEPGPIGLIGSSLGGLVSLHVADRYPGEYAFAASLSGTMGWGSIGADNETMIERYAAAGHRSTVLYVDSGGDGTCYDSDGDGIEDDDPGASDNYCENRQLVSALAGVGYDDGVDLFYVWDPGAAHNEAAWAARVAQPLAIFAGL
jgi:hypothetical protein